MKTNFGYTINIDRQIDYDKADLRIIRFVIVHEPSVMVCISCGTCAATCTAAQFTTFSLRELIVRLKRGETRGMKSEADKCMLCGKCQLICPRNVNTRNIILAIQKSYELTEV